MAIRFSVPQSPAGSREPKLSRFLDLARAVRAKVNRLQGLAEARQRAGLTQAEAAQLAGIALRLWQQYEAGEVEPSVSRFLEIAAALGIEVRCSLLPPC